MLSPDFITLTELLPESILLLEEDGTILFSNKAVRELLSFSKEELHGKKIHQFISSDTDFSSYLRSCAISREPLPAVVVIALSNGQTLSCRFDAGVLIPAQNEEPAKLFVRLNKKSTFNEKFAQLNRELKINDLINEKIRQAVTIQNYEKKIRLAMDSVGMGLWEFDFLTKKLIRTKHVDHIFGFQNPSEEINIDSFLKRVHPADRIKLDDKKIYFYQNTFDVEFRIIWPDNSIHWVLSQGEATKDAAGLTTGLIGAIIDITKMKEAEIKLNKAMRVRENFLSSASNELKSPLISLKLELQIRKCQLLEKDYSKVTLEHTLELIERSEKLINQVYNQINSMIDAAYINQGKLNLYKEKVVLNNLINQVIARLTLQYSNIFSQIIFNTKETITGYWDYSRIEQVIYCLLNNAIKYGENKPIHISIELKNEIVILAVKDSGKGISSCDHNRIFEQFEKINDHNSSGMGLGLYIVKNIIEKHNGTIEVESEMGQGAAFTVTLPLKV